MPNGQPRRPYLKLTPIQADYVKALYQLGAGGEAISTSRLAARLGISSPSATEMLRKLAVLGLVSHDRHGGALLTETGEIAGVELVRRQRLLELFLTERLHYTPDEAHRDAERLEHVISERLEQRIFESLGRPTVDCCGDRIPTSGGGIEDRRDPGLPNVGAGTPHATA